MTKVWKIFCNDCSLLVGFCLTYGNLPSQQGDFDVIAYVEAYMEVLTALGDAENDLYSANFADYAGGGGMTVS